MRDIFNSLKSKIDILEAFDREILDKKAKIKNTDSNDPKKLLKEYQDNLKLNDEILQLENIKLEFTRPDVMGDLVKEFYSNVAIFENEVIELEKEAESLKQKYIDDLKKIDEKHIELESKHLLMRSEYIKVAEQLGFDGIEAELKMPYHFPTSAARIIMREKIYF